MNTAIINQTKIPTEILSIFNNLEKEKEEVYDIKIKTFLDKTVSYFRQKPIIASHYPNDNISEILRKTLSEKRKNQLKQQVKQLGELLSKDKGFMLEKLITNKTNSLTSKINEQESLIKQAKEILYKTEEQIIFQKGEIENYYQDFSQIKNKFFLEKYFLLERIKFNQNHKNNLVKNNIKQISKYYHDIKAIEHHEKEYIIMNHYCRAAIIMMDEEKEKVQNHLKLVEERNEYFSEFKNSIAEKILSK